MDEDVNPDGSRQYSFRSSLRTPAEWRATSYQKPIMISVTKKLEKLLSHLLLKEEIITLLEENFVVHIPGSQLITFDNPWYFDQTDKIF